MRWFLGVALAAGIFAWAIVPTWRDRDVVATRVTVPSCLADLGPEIDGEPSLKWQIRLANESDRLPEEVTADQLIKFGFDRHAVAMLGQPRPREMDIPTPRPLWVRLRTDPLQGDRLVVEHVGTQHEPTGAHPNTIELLARVGFVDEFTVGIPAADDSLVGEPFPPPRRGGVIRVNVLELIPGALHLTAEQYRTLRADTSGFECRESHSKVVIAMGRNGALWVEKLLPRE